jgi:hypothetical protein
MLFSSLKKTANRFRKSVRASLQGRASKGIERSPEGPAAPDILRGHHKASSCNADHHSAENDKRQSRYVAEFLARQRQSATKSTKILIPRRKHAFDGL